MRLIDRLSTRAIQSTPWGRWQGEEWGGTWAGTNVDQTSALQLLAVYGSVRLIVDSIAPLPIDVYRKTSDGRVEENVPAWLVQPMVGMSRVAWLSQILTSLLLHGNAYLGVKRHEGRLVEIEALDPASVKIERENGSPVLKVNGIVPPYEVKHIPAMMLAGSDVGLSPIEYARQTIGVGLAAQEYGARWFGQGVMGSGVIETAGEMPPEQATKLSSALRKRHGGTAKAHLPIVLEGGASWKTIGVTNEQAQFLQTRRFSASEIAGQMFLIDPSDLGIGVDGTSLTYANLEQRNARRVQVTLLPWIVRIEECLSSLLPQPRYVKLNVAGLLRGDMKSRFESYEIGIKNQFLVPNEPRALEDMQPLEGGDEVVKPTPKVTPPPEEEPDA